ncbi:MAG: NAD-dependent DNA ligase LigA [Polyangiaceae bacterium]
MSSEIEKLEAEIRHHNKLYWDHNAPEISDYAYDALTRRLRELAPNSPVLEELGETRHAALGAEVRHKAAMLSLDKCYSADELVAWAKGFAGKVVAMPKYDGIACSLHYERGRLVVAATRGDGVTGDDITVNAKRIADSPSRLRSSDGAHAKLAELRALEVRGEIYMRLSVFAKFKAEGMSNPRNLAAGAVKQKDPNASARYELSFAAYDLLGSGLEQHEDILRALEAFGFPPVDHFVLDRGDAVSGYEEFAKLRPTLDYEIDGVVFRVASIKEQARLGSTAHHPRYAIAYKFQGDSGVTTLRSVEWSVARTGAITPVAIVDPVFLSGVTVERASLHNVAFIDRLNLSLGAKVTLVRRGGVIPNVEFVTEPGDRPVPIPTECPEPTCRSKVVRERDFLYCSSPATCRRAVIGQLAHFASALDMLGFGDSMLEQAYDTGLLRSPADFYTLDWKAIAKLERSGDKIAKKLAAEVDKKRSLDLATFLRALGIDELGKKVSQLLADRYRTLDAVLAVTTTELAAMHGVGDAIATSVVTGLALARDRIDALRKHITFREPEGGAQGGPWSGKSFVFTGKMVAFARSDGEKRVRERGGEVLSSVTKTLHYLVIGADKTGPKSAKEKAAEKILKEGGALEVISEEQFLAMLAEAPLGG